MGVFVVNLRLTYRKDYLSYVNPLPLLRFLYSLGLRRRGITAPTGSKKEAPRMNEITLRMNEIKEVTCTLPSRRGIYALKIPPPPASSRPSAFDDGFVESLLPSSDGVCPPTLSRLRTR